MKKYLSHLSLEPTENYKEQINTNHTQLNINVLRQYNILYSIIIVIVTIVKT